MVDAARVAGRARSIHQWNEAGFDLALLNYEQARWLPAIAGGVGLVGVGLGGAGLALGPVAVAP
jgi:hypothetical protein